MCISKDHFAAHDSRHSWTKYEADRTLVFVICSLRGERIRATKEVENSISSRAISPCFVS